MVAGSAELTLPARHMVSPRKKPFINPLIKYDLPKHIRKKTTDVLKSLPNIETSFTTLSEQVQELEMHAGANQDNINKYCTLHREDGEVTLKITAGGPT